MTVEVKTASERYQKISQLEHILKRPDTYIGSVESQEQQQWIHDEETDQMVEKTVQIVPGLYKIFDEILVNAADNKVRDPAMKKIEVNIQQEENLIEVKNDGKGIPIEIHEKEKIYIPELIFGHLLTSSNYDDEEKKVTGGRNGYGAKLCNIFSTEFLLETADPVAGKKYVQKWENNMSVCNPPKITSYKKGPSFTKVSFRPDLKRFGMDKLDDDIVGVLRRRVYDINGSVRDISVYLNGKSLKIRNFKNYVELYIRSLEKKRLSQTNESNDEQIKMPTILYERVNASWELAFAVSDVSFQQISFVNSIATTSGGTHVNYITDQIIKKVSEALKKQKKSIKPFQIKNHMFLFVNCLIENPAFTSQTKEQLTTRVRDFGSRCEISDDYVKKIMKTDLQARILEIATENENNALKKSDGTRKNRITDYPKLEDANRAGTKDGNKCTLVLTEGDSALSLAVAGLAVVGRDYYGCYPLRGKILNVREATADQINKNAEIQAIKKIMGLQHRKRYEDTSSLRYGHLMIMTDQDHDGSHIKGLIINFLDSSFPGLLDIPGFLVEFITPIVKVTITRPRREVISFYNMPDYEKWRTEESHKHTWKQKYYKGLGTSSSQEVRGYFSDLDRHLKKFHALESGDKELIELAFAKKKADDRKEWLRLYEPGTVLDPALTEIPISDFINKELILFSLADNIRSIPNVLDGFKPGQRKVLFGVFKRKMQTDIKVAQLAAYVAERTAYHHGETALAQTIVGLAQNFVGSNNINLLKPNGAFGTRATGGKDAAAARYLYTELSKITKTLFHPSDDPLYQYVQEDEATVEPVWYLPIIPMVLVNGAEGIGTGWSTNIPPFNPSDIVKNLKHLMNKEPLEEMHPWFKGWGGSLEKLDSQRYRMCGKIEQIGETTLQITELPARTWTSTIKEYLLVGLSGNLKTKPWIKEMEEQHGDTIKFIVELTQEEMDKTRKIGFYERFKLTSSISLSNMVAFSPENKIKRYENVNEILEEFFHIRLEYYQKRKDYMANRLQWEVERLSHQVRFIKMIIEKELTVTNKPHKRVISELESLGFPRINKEGKPSYGKPDEQIKEIADDEMIDDEEGDEDGADDNKMINGPEEVYGSYEYLLGMRIWSLTKERYEKLLKQQQAKEVELEMLLKLSAQQLWENDLDDFSKAYDEFMALDEELRRGDVPLAGGKSKGKRKRASAKDDDDYNPGKKPKKTKKTVNKVKQDPGFEKVILEPKLLQKPKQPAKVKTEGKSRTPTPIVTTAVDEDKQIEPSKDQSTIFDTIVKPEPKGTDSQFSAFSSKFKELSESFDDTEDTKKKSAPSKRKPPKIAKSDESDSARSDSEDEPEPIKRTPRAARNRRATKVAAPDLIELSDDSFIGANDEADSDESFKDEDE